MNKVLKKSICKTLGTVALAAFMAAGVFTHNAVSVKAKEVKNITIDMTNERVLSVRDPLPLNNHTKDELDGNVISVIMLTYYQDTVNTSAEKKAAKFTMSDSPLQAIDYSEKNNTKVLSAVKGAEGTARFYISKDILKEGNNLFDKWVPTAMKILDDYTKGIDTERDAFDESIDNDYIIDIKFSDKPVVVTHNGKEAAKVSSVAGQEFEENGIRYRIMDEDGHLSAIALTSKTKKVVIPDTVEFSGNKLEVTDIAKNFMKGNKKVTKVTIGANVTSIGNQAFYKCKKLKKVEIKSEKIKSVGKKAFGKNAKKFSVKMPKSCKKAYKKLFKKAKVKI